MVHAVQGVKGDGIDPNGKVSRWLRSFYNILKPDLRYHLIVAARYHQKYYQKYIISAYLTVYIFYHILTVCQSYYVYYVYVVLRYLRQNPSLFQVLRV